MSVLDELGAALVTAGVGILGTSLYLSSSAIIPPPAGPYVTLTEVGGVGPTRIQNSARSTQRPTIQILCRAEAYPAARAKAWAAYQALDGVFNTLLGSTMYLSICARQEPTDMGIDGNKRAMVVFNVDIEKAPS